MRAFDGIVAADAALTTAGLAGDLEVHLEHAAGSLLCADADFQDALVAPTRLQMPVRHGFTALGAVRFGHRCVRVYQRLT